MLVDVKIRFGNAADKAFLQTMDKHINPKYIEFKLCNQAYEINL